MVEFSAFFGFGLIIIFVTILGYIFRFLRQPLILAYIVAGIILGEAFISQAGFRQTIDVFSQLGVAFLLFLVGISLEPKALRQFGIVSTIIGISQIVITTVFGFAISLFFGFNIVESLYIGLALTFSSTIIVIKYLTDKKEISTLQGRIAVGAMLVQDFFSIGVILLASSTNFESFDAFSFISSFLFKAIVFFGVAILLSKLVAERFFRSVARTQELLFLSAISWCLLLSGLAHFLGFSIEVGSFVAGVLIASYPYSFEISSRLKNLRDFFLVLFFVTLGTGLALSSIEQIFTLSVILSLFVVLIQPILLLPVMFYFGYRAKTSFFVGMTMAQISEFSIIFMALGLRLGQVSQQAVWLVTAVAVITMGAGTLLLYNADLLFDKYFKWLRRFEKKSAQTEFAGPQRKIDLIFLGFGETAKNVYRQLGSATQSTFLVDIDPSNVDSLKLKGFDVLFADAQDPDVLEQILDLDPKIVFVSTDAFETNKSILKALSRANGKIKKFCTAQNHMDAKILYSLGADFVVIPKMLSSAKTTEILKESVFDPEKIEYLRKESLEMIEKLDRDF